jgi:hypothetical protein
VAVYSSLATTRASPSVADLRPDRFCLVHLAVAAQAESRRWDSDSASDEEHDKVRAAGVLEDSAAFDTILFERARVLLIGDTIADAAQ